VDTINDKQKLLLKADDWRRGIEDNWRFLYELYTNNYRPQVPNYGAVVNTGKVFELTETFVSYFLQALVFQEKFFDASPLSVGSQQYSNVAVELLSEFINTSNFYKIAGEALRQLVLTGNTGVMVSVRNKRLMFECLDMFRTYLLPGHSVEFPNFIYKYILTEGQLKDFWKNNANIKGNFDTFKKKISPQILDTTTDYNNANRDNQQAVAGDNFELCCHYYWCYEESKYKACWFSRELLYEEKLKQHVVPLVVSVNTLPGSPYGYSPLESCVGLISELTALKSYRLTAAKVSSWFMFATNDNMIPDDMDFAPNKVFHTSDRDSLRPLEMPANGYSVNAAEEQNLVSTIYTNIGLGSGVSANVARQAERVTATEIDALQKASGARLNLLFNVLESQLFSPLINYAAKAISEHKGKQKLRVYNVQTDSYDIYDASLDLLEDFNIVLDVSSVKHRLETVQKLLDFIAAVSNIPEANTIINYKNVVMDITHLYGLPDPMRYIIVEEPEPTQEMNPQVMEETQKTGINPDDNRILQAMVQGASGGDPSMMAMAAGQNPNDPQTMLDTSDSLIRQQINQQQQQEQQGVFT
jgi:hypothetical protein